MLFILGCLTAIVTDSVDELEVTLAWSFVVLRMIHTVVVVVRNDPRARVFPYALSTFAVWGIWVNLFRNVVWPAA